MIDRSHLSSRANAVTERFREVYRTSSRGIFRAPGRVNLIGEHTDYNDGFVMPAAIDFYSYAAIGERVDRTLSVHSEPFHETIEFTPEQLAGPPRKHWSDYVRGVAAVLQQGGYPLKGANLVIDGQVPSGAGLSSSAAIEVATAFALTSLGGLTIPLLEVAKPALGNDRSGCLAGMQDASVGAAAQIHSLGKSPAQLASSGRHYRSRSPIKLPGKRSQT